MFSMSKETFEKICVSPIAVSCLIAFTSIPWWAKLIICILSALLSFAILVLFAPDCYFYEEDCDLSDE